MKLEKDGFIELHLPDGRTDEEEATLSGYTTSEFMIENKIIRIKILPSFYSKYFFLNLISFSDNKWNYVNPFWILWNFFKTEGEYFSSTLLPISAPYFEGSQFP